MKVFRFSIWVYNSYLLALIFFPTGGIVAINKPFGMVTTDVDKLAKLILTDFLPTLSQLLRYEKLYTVHRLDRDTTGLNLLLTSICQNGLNIYWNYLCHYF